MIEFNCQSCQKLYRVAQEMAGKRAKCNCGQVIIVPAASIRAVEVASASASSDASARRVAPPPVPASRVPTARPAAHANSSPTVNGVTKNFKYEISHRPDFALVTVHLEQGQKVFAEPSAMASMTPAIHLQAGFKGGLGKTIGRALGGESLIINTFSAPEGPGEVTFAAGALGDAAYYQLTGNSLYLQRGAFMLHSEGVELSGKWQGAKGFFSGEGLVLLKATGTGDIFFNSYGAILQVDVTDDYIVDTGYIVAFEDTLQYRVTVLPGLRGGSQLKSLFFGGEGLVCQFSGQGRLWIQTRHVQSFLEWVYPFRQAKK